MFNQIIPSFGRLSVQNIKRMQSFSRKDHLFVFFLTIKKKENPIEREILDLII